MPGRRPLLAPGRKRLVALGRSIALILTAGLLSASCSGSSTGIDPDATPVHPTNGELSIRAFEWGFEPQVVGLKLGEEVRVAVVNDGQILHNLTIEDINAEGIESASAGGPDADEGDLLVWVGKGESGTLTFTPLEAGTFVFYCNIRGHRAQGMEGIVRIEP